MLYASLLLLAPAVQVEAVGTTEKIIPELRQAAAEAPAEETFRVYAALTERMTLDDFTGKVERLPRGERQQYVEDTLRAFADAHQGGVLALLSNLEAAGQATRVRQLWITNTVRFEGTVSAIEAVAGLPEVSYIGWDPVRDVEAVTDACAAPAAPAPAIAPRPTPAPSPAAGGGFTTYWAEDFESGSFPAGSTTSVTGCGDVYVTGSHGPKSGSFHMVMASTTDSCDGTSTFGIQADLSGATTAKIRFAFKDMTDEFDPGLDILEASNDGAIWIPVLDLTGSDGAYVFKEANLDGLGLVYDTDVYFRWRWADNFTPETDGFGIDEIEIADGFAPPPPPTPELNLIQHQATDMWALGFDGSDVLLLNIDDGTDMDHPDLVNRIWQNPADPIDGVDNDGNGYIDDISGWDFVNDNNDPDGGGHGTNTAGIMVGDGSSGLFLTGMAPGANLAVAQIITEADHWEALQWGISVGVDASSSSFSWKWYFSPKPDYHMHRSVSAMLLAAGIIHANSIGNDGGSSIAPIPFNISAPGLSPGPWKHFEQTQINDRLGGTMACGGIELDDSHYSFSGSGPSAWENLTTYDAAYPHAQNPGWYDFPVGGFGGTQQGLIKPDIVTYTNVASTSYGGGHVASFGGTSAATPHLGGTFCLLIDAQPNAEPRHISQALQRTAGDLGAPGKDNVFGAGKVQVLDAAMRLIHLLKVDNPQPGLTETVNLETYGEPNDYFATLWSGSLGSTATPVGTIDLGAGYFVLDIGQLDGNGFYSSSITVPNQAPLIGLDIYLQSVEDNLGGTFDQHLFSVVDTFRVTP